MPPPLQLCIAVASARRIARDETRDVELAELLLQSLLSTGRNSRDPGERGKREAQRAQLLTHRGIKGQITDTAIDELRTELAKETPEEVAVKGRG